MTKNTKSGSRTTATSSVDLWCVLVGKVGNLGESWFKINHIATTKMTLQYS